jgi:glutathionyl-hydroquinone reductase
MLLMKKDEASKSALLMNLRKINDHLTSKGWRFLTGDTMCCFDCELMPKLQHIRVAGAFFADFHIPGDLRALWKYFGEMYSLNAFTQSCPADQDIINHYNLQQSSKEFGRKRQVLQFKIGII